MGKNVKFSDKNEEHEIENEPISDEDDNETKNNFNKFQLLAEVDETDPTIDEDEIDKNDSDPDSVKIEASDDSTVEAKQGVAKKPAKRRNKKRKSKNKATRIIDDFELGEGPKIDRDHRRDGPDNSEQDYLRLKMLKIDTRNLQPDAELKRIFGKSVIRDERTRSRHIPGVNLQRSRFVSSGYFDTKPSGLGTGPKMELDDSINEMNSKGRTIDDKKGEDLTKKAALFFRFVHDKSYQEAHKLFLEAVNRGHPESIVQNLGIYPFHAESLIQLSHMVRVSEDYKTASEFIERALVVFERGFHPRFNIATANCRLSYKRPENRAFFIAIFKHINYCHRKGLRRTPFEYSKLLLSLEPENDPLLASQLLDFYALRSEEYDYLIEFVSRWQHLAKLPNMNFSVALAHYLKSRSSKLSKSEIDISRKLADECLQQALLIYPNFIIPLLDACSAEPDAELKKCNYFDYSVYNNKSKLVPETVDVLVSLYLKRNFNLWKPKYVLTWLEQNVATMVAKFASGELADEGLYTKHWTNFNKPVAKNLLRHIVLSDLDMKVPSSAAGSTYLDIDPYPPTDPIISYSLNTASRTTGVDSGSTSGGMSSLFLRSFMPSFSLGNNGQSNSGSGSGSNSSRHQTPASGTAAPIQEINLGDFVPDEAFDENPDTGFNDFQNSIRDLASSISSFLTLATNRRDQPDSQDGNANGNRDENQDQQNG